MKKIDFEKQLKKCKNRKKVLELLVKNNIGYFIQDEQDHKERTENDNYYISVWLDKNTRVYGNKDGYKVQEWTHTKQVPNGKTRVAPVCHGYTKKVQDTDTITIKHKPFFEV